MRLDEKLTLYETVIDALRNKRKVVVDDLPMEHQVEIIRFMEFLEEKSRTLDH